MLRLGRADQVRPEDVAVVVLSPNRFSSKPDRLLTKIRAAEVAVAIEPLIAMKREVTLAEPA